jgi:hypothetical protein
MVYVCAGACSVVARLPTGFISCLASDTLLLLLLNLLTDQKSELIGLLNALRLSSHAAGCFFSGCLLPVVGTSPLVTDMAIHAETIRCCTFFAAYLLAHTLSYLCVGGQGLSPSMLIHHAVFFIVSIVNLSLNINADQFPGLAALELSTVMLAGTYYVPGLQSRTLFLVVFFAVRIVYYPFYLMASLSKWGAFLYAGGYRGSILLTAVALLSPLFACIGGVLNVHWFKLLVRKHALPALFSRLSGVEWQEQRLARKGGDEGRQENSTAENKKKVAGAPAASPRGSPVVQLKPGLRLATFALRVLMRGELELGETYVEGEWTTVASPSAGGDPDGEDVQLYKLMRRMADAAGGADGSTFVATALDWVRWCNPRYHQTATLVYC